METITITNHKGGVGKTTTAQVLATGLTHRGYKVLGIDIDPQTNFTYTAGIEQQDGKQDIYDLFKSHETISSLQAIQKTPTGFSMIAGALELAGADMEFSHQGREYILKEILEPLKNTYDYCIIDTPPTLGILTVNALTASQKIIVPVEADIYSLQGLSQLQGVIMNAKKYSNPNLQIAGLLITKYNPRAVINKSLKEELEAIASNLHTKVFKSWIRETVAIKEVHFLQGDLFKEYPNHNVTKDYNAFIDEFLGKGDKNNGKETI